MLAPADSRTRWSRRRHNLAIMRHPAGLGQLALLICQPWQPVRTSTQLPLQQSTDDVVREAHAAQTERDAAGRWGNSLCRHFEITRIPTARYWRLSVRPLGLKREGESRMQRSARQPPVSSLQPCACVSLSGAVRKTTTGLQLALHVWLCLAGSACFGTWRYQTETQHSDSGCCLGCYGPSSVLFPTAYCISPTSALRLGQHGYHTNNPVFLVSLGFHPIAFRTLTSIPHLGGKPHSRIKDKDDFSCASHPPPTRRISTS